MSMNKLIYIFGGGTIMPIVNHLALTAPAFGTTARRIAEECGKQTSALDVRLILTKMADPVHSHVVTNQDLTVAVEAMVEDQRAKIVFFTAAVTDFTPNLTEGDIQMSMETGKYAPRLNTRGGGQYSVYLEPAPKIVSLIRKNRKDITLASFKTTCGATGAQMFNAGLRLLKESSSNLVMVNDALSRQNMVVTPEEAVYHDTANRDEALRGLVQMALLRSHLTFTRSTVVSGEPIPWKSDLVPESLRTVVDHCIARNAYKPFKGATVGHFAVQLDESSFLTSIRKSNFNRLNEVGMVLVRTDGPDTVIAYGAKPSVGGQSQRMVFHDHPGFDCVVHFHCPLISDHPDDVPIKSQREFECGSHECGASTSSGLKQFGNLKAIYLDQHGPNIVFPRSIDHQEVIDFIERNFDLSAKTSGYAIDPTLPETPCAESPASSSRGCA
jgi:hypothetical protein